MQSQTQIKMAGMGGIIGFDYPALLQIAVVEGVEAKIITSLIPFIESGMTTAHRKKQDQEDGER